MSSLFRNAALAGLAALALTAAPAAGQAARAVTKATHGDWSIVCAEGQPDVCVMRQIGKNAEGNDVLAVTVRALPPNTRADNGEVVPAVIDILAPLGVALRGGIRVKVDGGQERAAPFEICLQSGCLVRQPMGADFLAAMKAGQTAAMTVVSAQQGEVTINISLRGFTAGFNALN